MNCRIKTKVTDEVRKKIQAAIGEFDELLIPVKKRKLRWFDRRRDGITILKSGQEWTRAAENRIRWTGVVANSSEVPRRPSKVMG